MKQKFISLALLVCLTLCLLAVPAFAGQVGVSSWEQLQSAVQNADAAQTITFSASITAPDGAALSLGGDKSYTLELGSYTLSVPAGISLSGSAKLYVTGDGTIDAPVSATGTSSIRSGSFTQKVTLSKSASIAGGSFRGNVELTNKNNNITDGTFYGYISSKGSVSGGTFEKGSTYEGVGNNSFISGGIFYGKIKGSVNYTMSSQVSIRYETSGGSSIKTNMFVRGKTVKRPGNPTRAGFEFVDWYTSADGETLFDFSQPIIQNTTAYARWKDVEAPKFVSIADNGFYCGAVTFQVTDNDQVASVEADGTVLTPDADGNYTLAPVIGLQRLTATDLAGNASTITVQVNEDHTYDWHAENGEYWGVCVYCAAESVKRPLPTTPLQIEGADEVCRTQDYTFSFQLPETAIGAAAGYEFPMIGSDIEVEIKDGVATGTLEAKWYDATASSFKVGVSAILPGGYPFSISKTVQIADQHTGPAATCTAAAVCTRCGATFAEKDPENHTGTLIWQSTQQAHTQVYDCCGAVTVEAQAHTWKDGACTVCGYRCVHTGGSASCAKPAVCETCGSSYGEKDPGKHTTLQAVAAKDATASAAGNKAYWYCKDCGKYFSDAAASKETTKADTVIAKRTTATPATGDGPVYLWALLAAASCAAAGALVLRGKKRDDA